MVEAIFFFVISLIMFFLGITQLIHRNKKDNVTESTNAVCVSAGQKCQLSLNYIYDKFDQLVCVVVIVTDITEKEELIQQLNESNAKIERYNEELCIEVERQTESIRNLQEAVVYSISDLIEKKDGYTGGHTSRVSGYITILLRFWLFMSMALALCIMGLNNSHSTLRRNGKRVKNITYLAEVCDIFD